MNSFQNKNEYEILNAPSSISSISNNYSKYPLANTLNQTMQNTNYKDWTNMCAIDNNLKSINPFEANLQNSLVGLFAITAAIASLLSAPITGGTSIAAGTAIAAAIIPILWPSQENNLPDKLLAISEATLYSFQDQRVREDALTRLESLKDSVKHFENAFTFWINNPNSTNTTTVRDRFQEVNSRFVGNMAFFRAKNYEPILLSTYAQAARLHLLHLRDGITYAEKWNLSRQGDDMHGDLLYKEFNKYCNEYIEHCIKWYNESLSLLKSVGANWLEYNQYRTFLTASVLDVISLFSSYDPRLYKERLSVEILTRKLYTDPINYHRGISLEADESKYTLEPTLFTQLYTLTFYSNIYYNYMGHTNTYRYLSSDKIFAERSFGKQSSYIDKVPVIPNDKSIIYKIRAYDNHNGLFNVMYFGFWDGEKDQIQKIIGGSSTEIYRNEVYVTGNPKEGYIPNNFDSLNFKNCTHRLADVISHDLDEKNKCYSFAWTSTTISLENGIKNDIITQIPAVKAYQLGVQSQVIKGPGHTGGDLINLKSNDYLRISCQHLSNVTKKYFVRIRYATNGSLNTRPIINITIPGMTPQGMVLDNTFSGTGYSNLEYQNFGYKEFLKEVTLNPNQSISLTLNRSDQNSNSILLLDRIEFLPITPSIRKSKEQQNLEKNQKTVNKLFFN
ncbi:insecticidal delta-endotoxin Cry8Ea1 family protein [Bacillus cereus]|nr:insecticidal delta-endotoxin Cry8Ea1 family protein [Bacillus cereus]